MLLRSLKLGCHESLSYVVGVEAEDCESDALSTEGAGLCCPDLWSESDVIWEIMGQHTVHAGVDTNM